MADAGDWEKRGLRLTKIRQLLDHQGIRIPYSSLYRFAVNHCGFGKNQRATVRMAECEPGELAEVDFGRLALVRWGSSQGCGRQHEDGHSQGRSLRPYLPADLRRVRPPQWGQYKVHPNHHISFQQALYSVPHAFLGRTAWVRGDRKLVRIYVDGTLVKTHV